MKTIRINPHSFVDIITNSSTVIYTYVQSIDAVKEFINEVLANIPNLTVTADDLYEFKKQLRDPESIAWRILEDPDDPHHKALNEINEKASWGEPGYKDKWEEINAYVLEHIDPDTDRYDDWDSDFSPETELVMIPKQSRDEAREDLGELLDSIFSHSAFRDG
jgi:hypothetical protein